MHHLTCEISSPLHSVNLIVFILLLVHLSLRILPHHTHKSFPLCWLVPFGVDYCHGSWTLTGLSGQWALHGVCLF